MSWIVFVLAGVICNSLKNVATRKIGGKIDVYTVALVSNALALPLLWTSVLLNNTATIQIDFWWQMLLMLPFEMVVMVLFFKALTSSQLSYSFPFVSFMPVFVAIGSFFILGETVGILTYIGASIIVLGAFLMNLKSTITEANIRGILYMLGVAALWGYLIPMGSLSVTYSSAELYPAIYFTLATLLFVPIYLLKRTGPIRDIGNHVIPFALIGIFFAGFTIANWYAYSLGPATAISALTMLAIPVTSLIDSWYHKESLTTRQIAATILMTVGAIITIAG